MRSVYDNYGAFGLRVFDGMQEDESRLHLLASPWLKVRHNRFLLLFLDNAMETSKRKSLMNIFILPLFPSVLLYAVQLVLVAVVASAVVSVVEKCDQMHPIW